MGEKIFMKTGGGWINHSDKFAYIIIIMGILLCYFKILSQERI